MIEPKLMPPRVHPGMLRRGRLLQMLDDDAGASFTVVNAAVGYGKTTLVRSWCIERPEPVIWMTLDPADDDPVRLWTHLATGRHDDLAHFAVENFHRRETGIDFDAERLGERCQPTRHGAERADEIAMIAHQRRHRPIRQPDAARRPQHHEPVLDDRGLQRPLGMPPLGLVLAVISARRPGNRRHAVGIILVSLVASIVWVLIIRAGGLTATNGSY